MWVKSSETMPEASKPVYAAILIHLDADEEGPASDTMYMGYGSLKEGFYVPGEGTVYVDEDNDNPKLVAWMTLPDKYEP